MKPRLVVLSLVLVAVCGLPAYLYLSSESRGLDADGGATVAARGGESAISDEAGETRAETGAKSVERQPFGGDPIDRALSILVTDLKEHPIRSAKVRGVLNGETVLGSTDGGGRCRLPITPGEGQMRLIVEAQGYAHYSRLERLEAEFRVRLAPSTILFGQVREAKTGRAVSVARISLAHGFCDACEEDQVQVSPSGSFVLPGVPVGRDLQFRIEARGFPVQLTNLRLTQARERTQHDFILRLGVRVTGRVLDFSKGTPIVGMTIRSFTGREDNRTETDEQGRFQLLVQPDTDLGDVQLETWALGYCRLERRIGLDQVGVGKEVEILCPRSSPIEGVVRDGLGRPIAGAKVLVRCDMRARLIRAKLTRKRTGKGLTSPLAKLAADWRILDEAVLEGRSDAKGRFKTPGGVPWGTDYIVEVEHDEYAAGKVRIESLGGPGESTFVVVPLVHAKAKGTLVGTLSLNGVGMSGSILWRGATAEGWKKVGPKGEFRIEAVESGQVEVSASLSDPGRSLDHLTETKRSVSVAPGGETRCDFKLRLGFGQISGRVKLGDGRPAEGVLVIAMGPGRRTFASAKVDASGNYSIDVPRDVSPYRVSATGPFARPEDTRTGVLPDAHGVDFVLLPKARLRYRIIDKTTQTPVPDAELYWRLAGSPRFQRANALKQVQQVQGWFEFEVPAGTIELRALADAQGYAPKKDTVVLRQGGGLTTMTLALTRGATVTFRLAKGEEPLPANLVFFFLESDLRDKFKLGEAWKGLLGKQVFRRMVRSRGFRTKTIGGLSSGSYFLAVRRGKIEIEIEPKEIQVLAPETKVVLLRWRKR